MRDGIQHPDDGAGDVADRAALDARRAEVWTPEAKFPVFEERVLTWQPTAATASFTLALETLFQD